MFEQEIRQYLDSTGFETFHPKAVLFDMDGVLFDSMPKHADAWHSAMESFGIRMSKEEAYKYEGMRGVETVRLLCREQWGREISDEEAEKMYAEKSRIFSEYLPVGKIDGVERLMRKVKAGGMKICVVTGSGQKSLLGNLEQEFPGLISRDLIVTSFDVSRGKPAPDPYLMGLQKADVRPWEAVVVENAPLGVRAGVAAGIFTVAVNTGPLPDGMLAAEGASVVFGSMNDFCDNWEKLTVNI